MTKTHNLLVILFLFFMSLSTQAQMPAPVFDVTNYGAVGNGTTKNTAAIQAAIDACAGTGGTVYLHDGTFLSGMLTLKSDMTLYIAPTATLLGSTDILDYPSQTIPTNNWNKQENGRGFLFSLGAKNLNITGGGTINGNGTYAPWTGFAIDELERPIPVWLVQSNKVEFSNLTVKDGAMWNVVPFETDSLVIRNVTINSNIAANRDGIDIVDCHHVLIEGCKIYVDDDAICPKSGHARGVQDLIVRNCEIQKSGRASGIKCGTLGYGSFKDMLFEDITINDVNLAGIALESVDGANIENVIFRRIKMTKVASPFFIILGDRGRTPDGGAHKIGTVKNILFQDITASKITQNIGCPISGLKKNGITYKVKNITFDNVKVDFAGGSLTVPGIPGEYAGQYPEVNMWGNVPAYGFYLNHADSVVFKNCNFTVSPQDARPLIAAQDTSRVIVQNTTSAVIEIDNVATGENHVSNSGFANSTYLWDGLTNNGSNDSKATGTTEAWVEFNLAQPRDLFQFKLWQDFSGNRVTSWKVMSWDGQGWVDVFPYLETTASGWQIADYNVTTSKFRFYAKCASGGYVSIHELACYAARLVSNTTEVNKSEANSVFPFIDNNSLFIKGIMADNCNINIYNTNGSVVLSRKFDSQSGIDISSLNRGVYILKTDANSQTYVNKFVK